MVPRHKCVVLRKDPDLIGRFVERVCRICQGVVEKEEVERHLRLHLDGVIPFRCSCMRERCLATPSRKHVKSMVVSRDKKNGNMMSERKGSLKNDEKIENTMKKGSLKNDEKDLYMSPSEVHKEIVKKGSEIIDEESDVNQEMSMKKGSLKNDKKIESIKEKNSSDIQKPKEKTQITTKPKQPITSNLPTREERQKYIDQMGPWICLQCSKIVMKQKKHSHFCVVKQNDTSLVVHKVICKICSLLFNRKEVEDHIIKHFDGTLPFTCSCEDPNCGIISKSHVKKPVMVTTSTVEGNII
eukprot:TRINITY_DN14110_c1_g1_i1.p1 TRINITY_DN14110_c1_g1~~TRINITY_DN14110_c1_g1_i1.p1  ORF type:complete len:325 (+),score=90.35 TRINITY_DN14110_c1_g1_i1:83-976(+)